MVRGGVLNGGHNCFESFLARAGQIAIIREGDDPPESRKIIYQELHGGV
jgi:hypothetical protein